MSHRVSLIVGPVESVRGLCGPEPGCRLFSPPLAVAFAVAPVTVGDSANVPGWIGAELNGRALTLPETDMRRLAAASARGALAYVETDYNAGAGYQAAALWMDGALAFGPEIAWIGEIGWPISRALDGMGVRADGGDAYAAFGLGEVRSHADILETWPEITGDRVAAPAPGRPKTASAKEPWWLRFLGPRLD
ncbi:MAG: hypothetical protein JSR45_06950 [Proteobacteria bacterium]|nr:hypothetical protein [Pseudomonadota bacterium]